MKLKKINYSNKKAKMFKKYLFYTFLLFSLMLSGCSTFPKTQRSSTWAEKTLSQLTLREKIAQMLVYRMNMRTKDVSLQQWNEIKSLIGSDGIGTIHLWYGDAGSSLALMNKMQSLSKVPILFDADIEYGLNQ
jgi:hypothetical protein